MAHYDLSQVQWASWRNPTESTLRQYQYGVQKHVLTGQPVEQYHYEEDDEDEDEDEDDYDYEYECTCLHAPLLRRAKKPALTVHPTMQMQVAAFAPT